jgi:preprotein translocase subunit SecB
MSERAFLSPIALAGYEIRGLTFEVDPEKAPAGDKGDLSLGVAASTAEDDASRVMVELSVFLNASDSAFEKYGYRLFTKIAGFFVLDFGDSPPTADEQESLLLINGAALLYSTARAILTGLAHQSSLRSFTLPTVNMHEFLAAQADGAGSGEDAPG